MSRMLAALKLDMRVQWRARFYIVGIALGVLTGLGLRALGDPAGAAALMPVVFLLVVGGTGTIYVAGLVTYERGEHVLDALFVSPLRLAEYFNARLLSLALLLGVEGLAVVLVSGAGASANWLLLVPGALAVSVFFTLIGIILIARYETITDFLIPTLVVNVPLDLPAVYFAGLDGSLLWLLVPSSAPIMLIYAAWMPVEAWQLVYAVGCSAAGIALLYAWARSAFVKHVMMKGAAA